MIDPKSRPKISRSSSINNEKGQREQITINQFASSDFKRDNTLSRGRLQSSNAIKF